MALILEKHQLEQLRALQRNTSDRTVYQKLTVVLMLYNGFSRQAVADNLGLDPATVSRYSCQFVESASLETYLNSHYKPCTGKLTKVQLETVRAHVQANLCQAAHQVAAYIQDTFAITYRPNSVVALLHRLGFVYKKTTLVPSKADVSAQAAFVETFRQSEQQLNPNSVILFGDAVHAQHNTVSEYAWVQKGTCKTIPSNSARHRVNLHGAINPHQPCELVIAPCERMNGETTVAWLKTIQQHYAGKQRIDLYVDNARYYRSKQVAEFVATSRIRLHFLPPYSPNLNPIERLWKLLKREVVNSHYTPSLTDFRQRILDFFTCIGNYKDKLASLINTNFQILEPANVGSQYSL